VWNSAAAAQLLRIKKNPFHFVRWAVKEIAKQLIFLLLFHSSCQLLDGLSTFIAIYFIHHSFSPLWHCRASLIFNNDIKSSSSSFYSFLMNFTTFLDRFSSLLCIKLILITLFSLLITFFPIWYSRLSLACVRISINVIRDISTMRKHRDEKRISNYKNL
jgi:hypothetical protein